MTRPACAMPMTARGAFAPAILFGVLLSLPAPVPGSSGARRGLPPLRLRAPAERSRAARQSASSRTSIFPSRRASPANRATTANAPTRATIARRSAASRSAAAPASSAIASRRRSCTRPTAPPSASTRWSIGGATRTEARGGQFWDGRAADLVAQPAVPLTSPFEMNNPSADAVVEKIKIADYAPMMTAVFGPDGVRRARRRRSQRVAQALAAYERSPLLSPFSSNSTTLCAARRRSRRWKPAAWRCFSIPSAAIALACHAVKPGVEAPGRLALHRLRLFRARRPAQPGDPRQRQSAGFDLGLCERPGLEAILPKDVALASLCGAFKVPTLRNVAVRAPYFHNGAIAALRDAVAFHATRDVDPKRWYPTAAERRSRRLQRPADRLQSQCRRRHGRRSIAGRASRRGSTTATSTRSSPFSRR